MRRIWMVWLAVLAVWGWGLSAQAPANFDPKTSVEVRQEGAALRLTVPPGAHLKTAFMKLKLKEGQAGTLDFGPLPAPTAKDELGDGIWRGTVAVPLVGKDLKGGVEAELTYQPCTEGEGGVCFPPTKRAVSIDAAALGGLRKGINWGFLGALAGAFAAGLLASLTPCVYPMIPITMAIVGAKGASKGRALVISLALVLGMAVTYTALGVVTAKAGSVAGAAAQKPVFLIPMALLFGLFAFSLLGAFEIRLPAALMNRLQSGNRSGVGGAFTMGLVLGPISAPCVGPVVGSILTGIAQKGEVTSGALQLFVFALGMGVLFVAVGVFTAALPKSGDWLVKLKQVMGVIVLGFAVWTLRYVIPGWASAALWSLELLLAAALLGAFEPAEGLVASFAKGLAWLALLVGLLLGVRAAEQGFGLQLLPRGGAAQAEAPPAWRQAWMEQDLDAALKKAQAEGKVVLVDTYADWCAQCHELDEKTWPDPQVQAWIRDHAVAVRINTDTVRPDLAPRLQIRSYPTVLLLDAEGKELKRNLGFQNPQAMLGWLSS